MKKTLILIIKMYQKIISPFTRNRCRFHPSCSSYSVSAIEKYGALKGSVLSAKRVMKCNPIHSGGYDPVP